MIGRWDVKLPERRAEFHRDHKDWELKRIENMFLNIKKNDVLIDVGTEVGDYATLFTLWGAKVFCIEPQPLYWPMIKHHFDLNKVKPLRCFAGFASNLTKEAESPDFDLGYTDGWPNVALVEVKDWAGFRNMIETGISTPQTRLDDLKLKRVDIINIDVEGAEFEVLKGASAILYEQRPFVYVSIHPEMLMNDYGNRPEDIFDYMSSLGYIHRTLGVDHETHEVFYPWPDNRNNAGKDREYQQ